MQRILSLMLSALCCINFAVAGDYAKPVVEGGKVALLFTLGGWNGGNYQNGVGLKYFIANNMALRAALGFGYSKETTKNTATTIPAGNLSESPLSNIGFSIAPGIQINMVTAKSVVGYVGGQVSFASASEKREGNDNFGVGFDGKEACKSSTTTFGAAAFVGVEWFAWENVSIGAEYQLNFAVGSGTQDITDNTGKTTSSDAPSTTQFNLGRGGSGSFVLAIYL